MWQWPGRDSEGCYLSGHIRPSHCHGRCSLTVQKVSAEHWGDALPHSHHPQRTHVCTATAALARSARHLPVSDHISHLEKLRLGLVQGFPVLTSPSRDWTLCLAVRGVELKPRLFTVLGPHVTLISLLGGPRLYGLGSRAVVLSQAALESIKCRFSVTMPGFPGNLCIL